MVRDIVCWAKSWHGSVFSASTTTKLFKRLKEEEESAQAAGMLDFPGLHWLWLRVVEKAAPASGSAFPKPHIEAN